MIPRVRDNGFRRRDLSRFVASRRVRPPSPFRTPRSVPSRPLTLSIYISNNHEVDRYKAHDLSSRYTSYAQTLALFHVFLVKAARLAIQSMMSCHSVFALSILALSITANVWISTVQVIPPFFLSTLIKRLSIVLEIVSNCKVTRTKTKNPYVPNRKVGNIFNGRIDIFRAWEGEFFIDRNTDESRVVNRGTIST